MWYAGENTQDTIQATQTGKDIIGLEDTNHHITKTTSTNNNNSSSNSK